MRVLNPTENRRLNELVGFVGMTIAVLLLLSLVSYHASDISLDVAAPAGFSAPARNWIGMFGAYLADMLYQLLGYAALILPLALFVFALRWLRSRPSESPVARLVGYAMLLFSVDAFCGLVALPRIGGTLEPGGLTGALLGGALVKVFNPLGADLVALSTLLVALFLTTKFSFAASASWLGGIWPGEWIAQRVDRFHDWRQARAEARRKRQLEKLHTEGRAPVPTQIQYKHPAPPSSEAEEPESLEHDAVPAFAAAAVGAVAAAPARARSAGPPVVLMDAPALTPASAGAKRNEPKISRNPATFRLPSPGLLHMAERPEKFDEDDLKLCAKAIERKCAEFGVSGQIAQINPGPVVTTFEFRPEAGVKYSRITALADDLCLALRAESILIERMAGKSTVGIEVPNTHRQTIALREIIESAEFVNSPSKLTLALGKDLIGRIRTAELTQMPHLLIAGATGTGKSVFINSMLVSMLYKATPDELKLVLIDPKRLELGLYEDIPHLFTPVVTDPKVASNVLRNATREMENRLKILARRGVRNIDQYNRLLARRQPASLDSGEEAESPLPYIVIVIDELADLMMVDTNNVEESITRLAQMARAVGIHLILATQRPSVDVITGLIKANFPARISFRVATKVDSRTILDANGSESLLGRGDMLYLPAGSSRLDRVHGPLVTEEEIVALCDFWRSQAKPAYRTELLEPPKDDLEAAGSASSAGREDGDEQDAAGDAEVDDNLYEEAVRVVCEMGRASTSTLQRRLRIGYGRAARLIDIMEKDGIVGPADGPRPREVLKKREWMKEWDDSSH